MQACHPSLKSSRELQLFLETSEDEFAHEVARAQMEQGGGAKKTLASTLQMFKDLGHSTANLMSGKHDDEEEDPDYLKVCGYHYCCHWRVVKYHAITAMLTSAHCLWLHKQTNALKCMQNF